MPIEEVQQRRHRLMTGERTCPGLAEEAYWFPRHEAAYRWAVQGLGPVGAACDAGSGEGYGVALLSQGAQLACGIELDPEACRHAASTYPHAPVVRANLIALPLRDQAFDCVVSMQVIEHVWDVPGYLDELVRITAPGGRVVISTPNRPVFSPGLGRGERPLNPFHQQEFDAAQLHDLLAAAGMAEVNVHGLHHGARIAAWEAEHGTLVPAIIAAQVCGTWPPGLRAFAQEVTWEDFAIAGADGAEDLIAVARARW